MSCATDDIYSVSLLHLRWGASRTAGFFIPSLRGPLIVHIRDQVEEEIRGYEDHVEAAAPVVFYHVGPAPGDVLKGRLRADLLEHILVEVQARGLVPGPGQGTKKRPLPQAISVTIP